MRILLIDNHDSFSFNLAHLVAGVTGTLPRVVANDGMDWEEAARFGAEAIILSPGPGRPERPRDLGLSAEAIRRADVPILGVCLGHQALAHAAGARIVHAPEPRHGRPSRIRHGGADFMAGLPEGFAAIRYHSLVATDLPPDLEALAWSEDGLVMALRHRIRPWRGVQFHPESIASEHGARLIANFLSVCGLSRFRGVSVPATLPDAATKEGGSGRAEGATPPPAYRVAFRRIGTAPTAEDAFLALHADAPVAFWLDSSRTMPGHARFSFIGDSSGPRARVARYDLGARRLTLSRPGDPPDRAETRTGACLDLMREMRDAHRVATPEGLPFRFALGWVGVLGYEMKAETVGVRNAHVSDLPDALFVFADRALAFDHETGAAWALALVADGDDADARAAEDWFDATESRLAACSRVSEADGGNAALATDDPALPRGGAFRLDEDAYRRAIAACREALVDGESYELCLTNRVTRPGAFDPLAAYRRLRRLSPAPYAAFLRFGEIAILGASPERFLAIAPDGAVETRPIKGTRPRGHDETSDRALADDLATNEKDRAENLMIVDLLRNDLGRVARAGSVAVPRLFAVESFAQVHQLVSTVSARLAPGQDAFACVRACFPGGSMTGAPKERTMEILDRLEGGPRGLYSGALGYFSLDGAADLSIVIRTIVATPEGAHYGIGGAIVALSDPGDEWRETLVKGRALARTLDMIPSS